MSLLSEHLGVPIIGRKEFPAVPVALQGVNPQFLKHAKILPLEIQDGILAVAMADPADLYSLQGLEVATGLEKTETGTGKEVLAALEGYDAGPRRGKDEGTSRTSATTRRRQSPARLASEAPVIRLVNLLINRAVGSAPPTFTSSRSRTAKIRYRIDGVLHDILAAAVSRPPSSRASRSWRSSTSPSGGYRRTVASSSGPWARRSTFASPRCRRYGSVVCVPLVRASCSISSSSGSRRHARRLGG